MNRSRVFSTRSSVTDMASSKTSLKASPASRDQVCAVNGEEVLQVILELHGQSTGVLVEPDPCAYLLGQVVGACAEDEGVDVGTKQRFVIEEESGCCDLARDDPFGAFEEVLVVGTAAALGRAEGDYG